MSNTEAELDEILDSVYEAGYKQSRLQLEGKGANTITSTALWNAKQSILAYIEQQVREARLNELNSLQKHWHNMDGDLLLVVEERIATLTKGDAE